MPTGANCTSKRPPVAVYRWDTGWPVAPFARLEVSAGFNRFSRVALVPEGLQYYQPYPSRLEFALGGRAAVGVEYRFADNWVATASLAYRRALFGHALAAIEVPFAIAYIW
jgi:hypothetical protein